ncbi:MAG: hypothetical protein HFG04_01575 [Oscillibacter sp.]|jgi:thiamine monophosphate kinase|nr:hypothetical protein [Oscillibacter sp.]MCI9001305.1 hypothetical protein [Oscillibacter sp.]
MKNWKLGEKEFLRMLHEKMGNAGLSWRDDCVERPIAPNLSLVYSVDSARRWLSHNRQDDARVFGQWISSVIASDVIACGVCPKGLALDVGIDAFQDKEELFSFFDGVLDICARYGMTYEGGNINKTALVCGMSWGTQAPEKIIHRDGAQADSVLIATAPIGLGWAIELFQSREVFREKTVPPELLDWVEHYKDIPVVNLDAFREVWELGVIDCGMDLTDGIIEFGYEIYERTGLGVVFCPGAPHPFVEYAAARLKVRPADMMFEMGYDTPFSHGWCIRKEHVSAVQAILKKHKVPFTVLGEVTGDVSGVYRKTDRGLTPLPQYWDDKFRGGSGYEQWMENIVGHT